MLAVRRASVCVQQALCRFVSVTASKARQQMDPLQATVPEDQCILVDENDNAIGAAGKTECHLVSQDGSIPLHRAFSVFLFNSAGDLLLQKRAACKMTYANYFTNTCCSHPLSTIPIEATQDSDGLGIRHAAQRRLFFELGIPPKQAKPEEMKYLTRIHYKDPGDGKFGEHEIDYIIFLQKNVTLDPNPDEVSDIKYVKRNELDSFLSNVDEPLTPWFALIAKHQLKVWWDNLHQLEKFADHKTIHRYV